MDKWWRLLSLSQFLFAEAVRGRSMSCGKPNQSGNKSSVLRMDGTAWKKILTIETCQKGDRWQHNPTCPLCQLNQEDTSHLLEYRAQEAGRIPWRPVGPIVGSGAVFLVFPLLSAFVFVLPAGGLAWVLLFSFLCFVSQPWLPALY
jgi:hypothetical protein